ncbi:hypothetical protein DFH09DRAFT_1122516 [Mycena vulgaris]|nr:hypothetical protein DFH09DRAFT_1122516 [Mycena vulgaris]
MHGSPPASLSRRSSPSTSEKASSPRACSPPPAAQPSIKNPLPRTRPLVELIGAPFPSFDCETAVVLPFQDEAARDDTFQKELNEMLLDAALESHAWSSARPFHETDLATRKFEQKIMAVQAQEHEQEKTRQRLNDFFTRMRSALAALTGSL